MSGAAAWKYLGLDLSQTTPIFGWYGRRRRLIDLFQKSNAVFLETPGFDANAAVFASEEEIRMIIATSDPGQPFQTQQGAALTNVKGAMTGPGKDALSEKLDGYVDSLTAHRWQKIQQTIGRPAANDMGLSLNNQVEVRNHRAEINAK